TEPGGTFAVSTTATTEPAAAAEELSGTEFVFDVQTHLLDFDLSDDRATAGTRFAQGYPYASCGEDDWRACFGIDHWLEELFVRSDTTMAVISAVPILATPNPLSIEVMQAAKEAVPRVCGDDGRVVLHGQVNPNVVEPAVFTEGMRRLATDHEIGAWKVYTHVPDAQGWWLDDHDADAVQCGNAFLDAVREIGPKIVCVHKGFGGGSEYSSPMEIGAVAKANPDITFVVYHSGYDGRNEGPYDPGNPNNGIDRLLKSVDDAGVEAGANVYAELGSTWWSAMSDTTQAAHVLGKLLARFGEDRVLWGTDSIWYGSPQDQIQAFRTFQISAELQDTYGYPELTDTLKRKVFGQNAAALYGVDPVPEKCAVNDAALEEYRAALAPKKSYGPGSYAEAAKVIAAHGMRS
ncbi:MAG TPA: amidohydrolase family protein, partial [Acidimicrobiia bacterium]|nr:amidohydrolase family protein [Acidimicrobiia bacterium]